MSIKALITTLILGSSSAAMAKPVVAFSGSASVSLGTNAYVRDHRAPVVVRDHRHDDDCDDAPVVRPAPIYTQPVYQPVRPIYREPWFNPTNTRVTASGSTYLGAFGRGALGLHRDHAWHRPAMWFNLTEATRIDSNREFFNLRQSGGSFSKIKLQNLGGRTEIRQVAIEYRTRRGIETQKVRLGMIMDRSNPSMTINLSGDSRTIQRVIVYGESGRGSAYQILAM
jgi:hypothetical protein